MKIKKAAAALGLAALALFGTTATAAADPGVPAGYASRKVEVCSYGDYSSYIVINSAWDGQNSTGSIWSQVVQPNRCWSTWWTTYNQWARIDVKAIRSDGSVLNLGETWFNTQYSGRTIHTGGGQWSNPYFNSW